MYAIQRLTGRERSRFRKYLESPYFNTDERLLVIYDYLDKAPDKSSGESLTEEAIWVSARGEEPFNNARFRKYLSDLLKLLEGFLYQEYAKTDKAHEHAHLLEALHTRKMDRLYASVVKASRNSILKYPKRDSRHYQRKYSVERRFYEISDSEMHRGVISNSREIADALDYFYIIEKLRIYCSVLGRLFYLDDSYELRLMPEVIQEARVLAEQDLPAVRIYLRIIDSHLEPDNYDNYVALKADIIIHGDLFEPDELVDIYYGAVGFLVRRSNAGDRDSLTEIVDLYDRLLSQGVVNAQNELSPWTFKNAILASLRTGQTEWALECLEKYSHRLPQDYRENALAFNYAQVYFYRKDFGKVLEYLQKVEYEDPAYALNSRNLLVAVYYEMGQIESLYSATNSFRTYLKRQKQLSSKLKSAYRNLLTSTLNLAKATSSDTKRLAKIQTFLEDNPSTGSRQWLLDKLEELKAGQRKW